METLATHSYFDSKLQPGDAVMVHWTNSGHRMTCPGNIVTVNRLSVRVRLIGGVKNSLGSWASGQEFSVPRFKNRLWSINNCVTVI